MKIREPWKKGFEQATPEELHRRVLGAVKGEFQKRRAESRSAFLFPFWQTALLSGAMGAAAIYFVVIAGSWAPKPAADTTAANEFAEMMRERALLKDLKLFRRADLWQRIEKRQWDKKKS